MNIEKKVADKKINCSSSRDCDNASRGACGEPPKIDGNSYVEPVEVSEHLSTESPSKTSACIGSPQSSDEPCGKSTNASRQVIPSNIKFLAASAPDELADYIESKGYSVRRVEPLERFPKGIADHPDLRFCRMGVGDDAPIVVAPEELDNLFKLCYGTHINDSKLSTSEQDNAESTANDMCKCTEIITGSSSVGAEYPADITYNAACTGKFLICNAANTAAEILDAAKRSSVVDDGFGQVRSEHSSDSNDEAILAQRESSSGSNQWASQILGEGASVGAAIAEGERSSFGLSSSGSEATSQTQHERSSSTKGEASLVRCKRSSGSNQRASQILGEGSNVSAAIAAGERSSGSVEAADMALVDVKQGYAKCSTVVVDERSIITYDRGIAKAASTAGMDVLVVAAGGVKLRGYNTGFIGGASGRVGDEIVFNGDLSAHPDFEAIKSFIEKKRLRCTWFEGWQLTDIGSIV